MDENFRFLRGNQPECDERRLGGRHVVVPVGQAKSEVLPEIADRRGARGERGLGILHGAGQAHHEVAEMCRSGRCVRDAEEILRPVEHDAGPARPAGARRAPDSPWTSRA